MTNTNNGALPGAPEPALDLTGYTEVVIQKTDVVDGHEFRRGQRFTVDGPTLAQLREKGMILDDPAL